MFRELVELAESRSASLWLIILLCVLLFLWTEFMCYLPLWLRVGKLGLSFISALGAGLMVGAAFCVVIPESISDALEHSHAEGSEEAEMAVYRLIGICITSGFSLMMMVDALTHRMCGHSHSHGEHEHGEGECGHDHDECGHNHGECDHTHVEDNHCHGEGECNHEDHNEEINRVEEVNHRHPYQATVWGLCFHSIFDGVAIGATMLDSHPKVLWIIFFAIVLHKSAASFGLGAYFKKLQLTVKQSLPHISIFAATTPVATFCTALATLWVSHINETAMPVAFAFSAGTFLYVSITHIVPEIGSNLKAWHLIFMVIGIMLPYFLFIDADHAGD